MLQRGFNLQTASQAIDRVLRIGQAKYYYVKHILTYGTYTCVVEDKAYRKMIPEILFRMEGQLPSHIQSFKLKTIIAYEVMKEVSGQPFNYFSWLAYPPADTTDYFSDKMVIRANTSRYQLVHVPVLNSREIAILLREHGLRTRFPSL
ncbi:hypothetical protein QBC40DRAFT_250959 [Triangularia verruculosa]|uniref:Uncharacterized protein n=1 Tax=Triangularia verruculosa TaxID=2587418 RepID=A0AAN6XTM5_9PEZI|nr:hypothetical protein QBC40DRAFT_250959 [Triangularia verruculosa]